MTATTKTPASITATYRGWVDGEPRSQWIPFQVKVGDFLSETLVTDTRVYQVAKVTARTVTLRGTTDGERVRSENRDGNPYPCVWTEAVPVGDEYEMRTVRLRKDGTLRVIDGGRPLRPAQMIDGKPVTYTDYRV